MLADYPGTVIVVSHDRDFLDRVATSVIVADGGGQWTEYPGGYSDMVTQRGYGVIAPADAPKAKGGKQAALAPVAVANAAQKQKLSFKQKHALEQLPKEMKKLEAEIAKLNATLADPALYAKDPKRFATASDALTKAQAALSKTEDEWLELEALREEIEA
jgi:ATP-binding cassette subfamily F protein uup